MTTVLERVRSGREAAGERWRGAPRWVRWALLVAVIAFFYALPNREFYQYLGPIPTPVRTSRRCSSPSRSTCCWPSG